MFNFFLLAQSSGISNLLKMDVSYLGQPFVQIAVINSRLSTTMDVSHLGQPFTINN